jgi:DNA repair protein NreA
MSNCKICGEENCKKHSFLLGKAKTIKEFSGSSPPEIFVGKWNYPNVYTGILSPQEYGDTQILSSPEIWHKENLPISEILKNRNKLIYGRTQSYIKNPNTKFLSVVKEVAMTEKSIATEFKLKKPIIKNDERDPRVPLISKAAQVESVRLQENTKVAPKVDYLVNDTDVLSSQALIELDKAKISTSSMIKILSAGLLGLGPNRKLVPTRWSITAVDDTLSRNKLEKIRFFQEIKEIEVFHSEYLGNHYEFLLLPEKWSFEVIEISIKNMGTWYDFESFFPRKKYAESVTGAYYANRLALTEYLSNIKRQCRCIVIREIRPEYTLPLGVGILRQISRDAFSKPARKFTSIHDALNDIQSRLKLDISSFISKSTIIKEYGKQKKLFQFL